MGLLRSSLLFALMLSVAAVAAADPYEALVTGQCFESSWGYYGTFSGAAANGTLQPFSEFVENLAQAPNGRLFGFQGFDVVEVLPNSTVVPLFANATTVSPVHMVVGANGTTYVVQEDSTLQVIAANGDRHEVALPVVNVAGGNDLAADQCTLYSIDNYQTIKRFNVCTDTPLPDFATGLIGVFDVRVLPDGGVLASTENGLSRFNSAGQLTRTYAMAKPKAIGLANSGNTAIVGHTCLSRTGEQSGPENNLERVDLESGVVTTIPFDHYGANDIIPYRSWTAALGSANAATDVPTVSTLALLFLGALMTFAAFVRMR